jgi:3-phytase
MTRREITTHISLLLLIGAILYGVAHFLGQGKKDATQLAIPEIQNVDSLLLADYFEGLPFQLLIRDSVLASVESDSIPAQIGDDAVDDPAIWVHPGDPSLSTVIVTNKKGGMAVYDLQGKMLHYYEGDAYNNVDVRSRIMIGNESIELVAASNISTNGITFFRINVSTRGLVQFGRTYPLDTTLIDEVYGICLGRDLKKGKDYVIVNGKNGNVVQYELKASPDSITLTQKRKISLSSQPEGMVVDDELGYLYIGEETRGIWKYSLSPGDISVSEISEAGVANPAIRFDIEGLAIYYAANKTGYLIASSQGNFSYALFERSGDNKYLGSFKVSSGPEIDGVEETDGLDVCNLNFGPAFPNGFLVVQDGYNFQNGRLASQNIKLIPWEAIANTLSSGPLVIDNKHIVR